MNGPFWDIAKVAQATAVIETKVMGPRNHVHNRVRLSAILQRGKNGLPNLSN
jgi:hypothetical protein